MRTQSQVASEIETVKTSGRKMNQLQNEGGQGYDHTDAARLSELAAELSAAKDAEWTLQATTVRCAAWNAEVKAGNRNPVAIAAKLGYNLDDLRAAVKRHGL